MGKCGKKGDRLRKKIESVNRLPGDTSFETGIGGWHGGGLFLRQLSATGKTGFHGKQSLELTRDIPSAMSPCVQELLHPGKRYTLSFYARAEKAGTRLIADLINNHWQWTTSRTCQLENKWNRYSLAVDPKGKTVNGIVFFRLADPEAGPVQIDAVQLEEGSVSTPYVSGEPVALYSTTGYPGEVVVLPERPVLNVSIHDYSLPDKAYPLLLTAELNGRKKTFVLNKKQKHAETFRVEIPYPEIKASGYHPVRLTLSDAGGTIRKFENASFLTTVGQERDKEGFFGLQADHLPIEILPRIGCGAIRTSVPRWHDIERNKGEIRVHPPYDANRFGGLHVTYITGDLNNVPEWAKKTDAGIAEKGTIGRYIQSSADTVRNTGGVLDLQNEPDLTLLEIKGMDRKQACQYYSDMLKEAGTILRKAGRPLQVNHAGGALWFAEEIFRRSADSFDLFAPHPYVYPRDLGANCGFCADPETGGFREQMKQSAELIRKYGNRHGLVIGELGWRLDPAEDADSVYAHRFAAYLARTFLLAKTYPCKRLIWYSGLSWGGYGIWRNENGIRPLPPAAAYAHAATMLRNGKNYELLAESEVYLMRWQKGSRTHFALWQPDEKNTMLELEIPEAEVSSIYGAPLGKNRAVSIGEAPVYFTVPSQRADMVLQKILNGIAGQNPLAVTASLKNIGQVHLQIRNNLPSEWCGTFALDHGKAAAVRIPPKGNAKLDLPCSVKEPVLNYRSDTGKTFRRKLFFPAMTPVRNIASQNWKTFEFQKTAPIVLNRRSDVFPPDPFIRWEGPDDLSVRAFLGWDKQNFYLMAEVTDDEHTNPFQDGQIWQGDSIQFAFDTKNDAIPGAGRDNNDYEFGISTSGLWCWHAPAGKKAPGKPEHIQTEISKSADGKKVIYRLAIPWKELAPLTPEKGQVFGFSMAIHDRDGNVRNYYMAFGQGIANGKSPAQYKKVYLEDIR